jgi:hypothetical protein
MNIELITYGTNTLYKDINNTFTISPFTYKNKVKIKILNDINLSFSVKFDNNIEHFILKINNETQIINEDNTINLNLQKDNMILLIPKYNNTLYKLTDYYITNLIEELLIKNATETTNEKFNKLFEENSKNLKDTSDKTPIVNPFKNLKPYSLTEQQKLNKSIIENDNPSYEFINSDNISKIDLLIPVKERRIIITMSVIPSRLLTIEFYNNLKALYNQTLKADYIVINFCKKYKRDFTYDHKLCQKMLSFLKKKLPNLIVNICENDYGPITKILGLIDSSLEFKLNDIIIVVDDDWIYDDYMTLFYYNCYTVFNCDCIFVDEKYNFEVKNNKNNINPIFYDNYKNFAYGWLSYSFEYNKIKKLKHFYNKIIKKKSDIWLHDDLIITLYYKYYKYNACGICLFFNKYSKQNIIDIDALKNIKNAFQLRKNLEQYFFKFFGIKYILINNNIIYINNVPNLNNNTMTNKKLTKITNISVSDGNTYWYDKDNIFIIVNNNLTEHIMSIGNDNYKLKLIKNAFSNNFIYKVCMNDYYIIKNIFNINTFYDDCDDYLKMANITINVLKNNSKYIFRYFCYKYTNIIRNIKLPNIELDNNYESVLIEFRVIPNLEFLIRNNIIKLGEKWSHTVICGNINYEYVKSLCKTISENIKIIKLDYNNIGQSEYSKILSSIEFWNLLVGEKILIYQEDSCLFKYNISDFLEWDYIGAPWTISHNDNSYLVGNGGFSLRTKQIMIDVINTISIIDTKFNSSTIQYMKNTGQNIGPEDVYFTKNMIEFNIGRLADWNTAFKFSSEWVHNPDSLGGHCFWYSNKNWLNTIYERIFC